MERANAAVLGAATSRAERFEDEKRRIINSCFNKKDGDGSLQETYITHIRITEYSTHPTAPPPPQARNPDVEKPRVVIVAVRRSGRVRLHKSKENVTGTFSIGKTWNLDDLTHIESYTSLEVNPTLREWGGETGFLVTLGKPYFWQAQTDKEKKFFIASLIKIYGKYTGGRVPELSGFDRMELDQVLGAGARQIEAPSRPLIASSTTDQQFSAVPASTVSSSVRADAPRYPRAPLARPSVNDSNSRAGSFDSSTSRERPVPRWTAQNNMSQDSVASELATRSEDASGLPLHPRNGTTSSGKAGRFGEPHETPEASQDSINIPTRPQHEGKLPPERRRPPMDPSRPHDKDLVPPPLMSSITKRDPLIPPPRSTDRASPQTVPSILQPGTSFTTAVPGNEMRPMTDHMERDKSEVIQRDLEKEEQVVEAVPVKGTLDSDNTTSSLPTESREVRHASEEELRPGLGPMIKSKKSRGDIAGTLWKAAAAANAFRPRPGGAGDRLRQSQGKRSDGPDGITSVVPAPPRSDSRDANANIPDNLKTADTSTVMPEVRITVPSSSLPTSGAGAINGLKGEPEPTKDIHRRYATVGHDGRYLQTLGVASVVLNDRGEEFGKWLDVFGWVPGEQMRALDADDVRSNLERELNSVQAGGWLARLREEDERVDAIKAGIDIAMAECEELDNLLTLYSVELSTLSDDIAYIEAQGQGLQVQTANQKLLKKELESLLQTCAITSNDLQALQHAPLETLRGLEDVESSLVTLFKAMSKIDPSIGDTESGKPRENTLDPDLSLGLSSDYSKMRIVQEKKELYLQETRYFMKRLLDFMKNQFQEAYSETKRALDGALSKKVDPAHHSIGRDRLWKYSPLMLYARDAEFENWNRLIHFYQDNSHPLYKHEFQNVITIWRKNARKLTGEETELLFSSQGEKQQDGVATTARKLTVKRSQTLARALRSPLADGGIRAHVDKSGTDTRNLPFEVFSGVLDDLLPLVEMEQNFIIDFFHATTLEQIDFPDTVAACLPRDRRGGDLKRHRLMEPDREVARRVTRSMEVIFAFLEMELQRLMEWAVGQDPLQSIGVLATLERKLTEIGQSNQDFLNTILQKVHHLLEGRFKKFVDEQIRAIEETKVKVNKRRGVISFVRIFPAFMATAENMLIGMDQSMALRRTVNREYDRILKTMFDSLMVIAREHPGVGVATSTADPEDKEALNFHILLIENMNHFIEEVDTRDLEVLQVWKNQANTEYDNHMALYLSAVMRRPLGKLLEHLENIEAQLQTGKSPMAIARQPSNNSTIFNKILGSYDAKEIRKGIEALRKRVEKHFGDADDPALSRGLVSKVLKECEEFYSEVGGRLGQVTNDVYGGDVLFEWPRADIRSAFR